MEKESMLRKIIRVAALTAAVYGFFGWVYIALCALVHPQTLSIQFTHLTPWLREDTFGIISFGVSIVGFFMWNMLKEK